MENQKTIGILGGGQLGRMLTQAAKELNFRVIVMDPGANCPAAQVGAEEITADWYDKKAIRKLAEQCDYLTIEFEHLDTEVLDELEKSGKKVNPKPQTVRLIQDKL